MSAQEALATIDFEAIKGKQRTTWASGDYAVVASTIQYMSELLCESIDLHAGDRVLDVATGSGNAAIAAARRGAVVTGIDFTPGLLEQAARRAEAERVHIDLMEGDAEALPFPDDAFDTMISVVGVMFAPNQRQAAAELIRVCRPGGLVAVASWTPDGFVGALLRLVGSFVAPPAGLTSPTRWGTREGISELMGDRVDISWVDRTHLFKFHSAQDLAEFFIAYYGPTERAYASLEESGRRQFMDAFVALAEQWNIASDGTLVVPGAYLEVHARVS